MDSWIYEGIGQGHEDRGPVQFKGSPTSHGQETESSPTSYEERWKMLIHGVLRSQVFF